MNEKIMNVFFTRVTALIKTVTQKAIKNTFLFFTILYYK